MIKKVTLILILFIGIQITVIYCSEDNTTSCEEAGEYIYKCLGDVDGLSKSEFKEYFCRIFEGDECFSCVVNSDCDEIDDDCEEKCVTEKSCENTCDYVKDQCRDYAENEQDNCIDDCDGEEDCEDDCKDDYDGDIDYCSEREEDCRDEC